MAKNVSRRTRDDSCLLELDEKGPSAPLAPLESRGKTRRIHGLRRASNDGCARAGMCDNRTMTWLRGFVALGVSAGLLGCASQHQTAQALTVVGAAAVVVGASMASDEQCYEAGPGEGGGNGYCSPGYGKATRNAGKGLAAAGVGLAAAGYAMTPKGPDRTQQISPAPVDPASPYRLIRRDPPPEQAIAPTQGASAEPAPSPECSAEGAPATEENGSCPAEKVAPAPPARPSAPVRSEVAPAPSAAP
jgi:hypothetical protein